MGERPLLVWIFGIGSLVILVAYATWEIYKLWRKGGRYGENL